MFYKITAFYMSCSPITLAAISCSLSCHLCITRATIKRAGRNVWGAYVLVSVLALASTSALDARKKL